ncbi:MAG: ATP-binding cassette domain-containing protein [Pseudomonadota bacterium]
MIEARDLKVVRGGKTILNDVSLTAEQGEVLALIGPNGAGKSTLLNCLSGSIKPDQGQVLLGDCSIDNLSPNELAKRRSVLDQNPTASAFFRVDEMIQLGLPIEVAPAQARALVADAIDAMGLSTLSMNRVDTLSGGEAHRAHMARTLVQLWAGQEMGHGLWLLLDEPTASLDLGHQACVLDAARAAAERGAGVVVICHDLTIAFALAQRVALMNDGKIVAIGSPSAIITADQLEPVYGVGLIVSEPRPGLRTVSPNFSIPTKETDDVCSHEPLSGREGSGGGFRNRLA